MHRGKSAGSGSGEAVEGPGGQSLPMQETESVREQKKSFEGPGENLG